MSSLVVPGGNLNLSILDFIFGYLRWKLATNARIISCRRCFSFWQAVVRKRTLSDLVVFFTSRATSSHHPLLPQRSLSRLSSANYNKKLSGCKLVRNRAIYSKQTMDINEKPGSSPKIIWKPMKILRKPNKNPLKSNRNPMKAKYNPTKTIPWKSYFFMKKGSSIRPKSHPGSHPPDWPTWRPAALAGDGEARAAPERRPGSSGSERARKGVTIDFKALYQTDVDKLRMLKTHKVKKKHINNLKYHVTVRQIHMIKWTFYIYR